MNGTRVFARNPDGTEVEVTEGVRTLYDLVINSMDWGSGFLTYEDALPVLAIAETCEFGEVERVRKYVTDAHFSDEQMEFVKNREVSNGYPPVPHDHVFASGGRCMWPWCQERQVATP